MATGIVAPTVTRTSAAAEARDIHQAVCRARRQGLVCSTCVELAARADRAVQAVATSVSEAA
jgi:hypothetical protein